MRDAGERASERCDHCYGAGAVARVVPDGPARRTPLELLSFWGSGPRQPQYERGACPVCNGTGNKPRQKKEILP